MNYERGMFQILRIIPIILFACGPSKIQPVEIFPEDNCANCRMAISDRSFASEFLADGDEAFKFDDLRCLESFRKKHPDLLPRAVFVVDYETKEWLPYESSVLVTTGIESPMGSGQIAVRDSGRARMMVAKFPVVAQLDSSSCCGGEE